MTAGGNALGRRESDWGTPDHNRSEANPSAPGFRQGAGRSVYGEVLNPGMVQFVGLRSFSDCGGTAYTAGELAADLIVKRQSEVQC